MKLVPNNWLYNAGLVGLLRVLQLKGVDVPGGLSDGSFELQAEDLEGFADAYCKYVLQVSLERLIPSKRRREDQKDRELLAGFGINYTEVRSNCLERLYEALQLTSSVKQAEESVKAALNALAADLSHAIQQGSEEQYSQLTQTEPVTKTEQREREKKRKELEKNLEKAKKIIEEKVLKIKTGNKRQDTLNYIDEQKYLSAHLQHFYFNKDTVANPSPPRGRRRSEQFHERFVSPARNLIESHAEVDASVLRCKFCGYYHVSNILSMKDKPPTGEQRLKDVVFNEGMFSLVGISIEQFPNFFYNLIPDLFICDLCELVLLCAWVGFNLIPFRLRSGDEDSNYLFVNLPSLLELLDSNETVRKRYEITQASLRDTIYEEVISELFSKERRERSKWVLQNVLFIEIRTVPSKQRDKPTFKYFHIGKDVAELFTTPAASGSLHRIRGRITVLGDRRGSYWQLKREVVKRLLSGDQVYDLAYQVCRQSLDTKRVRPESVIEIVFLHSLRRQIWRKYTAKEGVLADGKTSGGKGMEARQVYGILRGFYSVGTELGRSIELEKRQRLAYRLMSIVRSGKFAEFYDMLMKLYVDSKHPIPISLLSLLNPNDAIEFESKAYALLSGFLGESKSTDVADTVGSEAVEGDLEISSEEGEDNG